MPGQKLGIWFVSRGAEPSQFAQVDVEPSRRVQVQKPGRSTDRPGKVVHCAGRSHDHGTCGCAQGAAVHLKFQFALEDEEGIDVIAMQMGVPRRRIRLEGVFEDRDLLAFDPKDRAADRLALSGPHQDDVRHEAIMGAVWRLWVLSGWSHVPPGS